MANIQSLFILVAAFLYCEVVQFSKVSAANSNYYSTLKVAAATKLRNGECQDGVWALAKCKSIVKQLGLGICYTQIPQLQRKLRRSCPGTCRNLCPVAANKLIAGELKKSDDCKTSKYGCCWDNYTSRLDSLGIKGCPECKDHLRLCPRFKKVCNDVKYPHNRSLMELHCPLTCRRCVPLSRSAPKGRKIKMTDWSLL